MNSKIFEIILFSLSHSKFGLFFNKLIRLKKDKLMANGIEDLKEKNKDCELNKIKPHEFTQWTNFQGREDAEMLEEKSAGWSALKSSKGDYDAWDED